jgi:hypothetical protein
MSIEKWPSDVGRKEVQAIAFHPHERPLIMRRRKAILGARVNGDLHVEFNEPGLTSYAGLELFGRYLRRFDLNARVRRHLDPIPLRGDFRSWTLIRVLVGLLVVGGRRLRHVRFVKDDPLFLRFTGLKVLPGERTLSRWLKQFRKSSVRMLQKLNAEIVAEGVRPLALKRVTLDVDGTVISTGLKVQWAHRGFNPHHRKVPSYYPITAALAQTRHLFRLENRPGNIQDGKAALRFLRDLWQQVTETWKDVPVVETRFDGAFFRADVLRWLKGRPIEWAIKVPFYHWVGLKERIQKQGRWKRVNRDVSFFEEWRFLEQWGEFLRVVVYRKRVHHTSPKNYQLDLFDPDDGYFEYSAIATNRTIGGRALWHFLAGRGDHEKLLAELKGGYALHTVPTNHYGANSAWQQIVVLAHNLITNLQLATLANRKPRSLKRTSLYRLMQIRTLRFELFHRAGRLVRPAGYPTLRLSANSEARSIFQKMALQLAQTG